MIEEYLDLFFKKIFGSSVSIIFKNFNSDRISMLLDELTKVLYEMEREYPYPVINIFHNNQNITIIGVLHSWLISKITPLNRWNYHFKTLIENSDGVVLEGPDFIYNQEGLVDDILRVISIFSVDGMGFFWEREIDGKNNRKQLYVIDPITFHGAFVGLIPLALGKKIAEKAWKRITGEEVYYETRREFIKDLIKLGTGLYLSSYWLRIGEWPNIAGTILTGKRMPDWFPRPLTMCGPQHRYCYDYITDARNIYIAEGLDKLTKFLDDRGERKKLIAFHGAAHSDMIRHYLEHPEDRSKRKLYLPFELVSDTSVRIFEYHNGEWKLIERIDY